MDLEKIKLGEFYVDLVGFLNAKNDSFSSYSWLKNMVSYVFIPFIYSSWDY